MNLRDIRGSARGVNGTLLAILALIGFIVLAVTFLLEPAFFLSLVLILAGVIVLVIYRVHPYGIFLGVTLIILAVVLALFAQAQQLSLSLVHGL